jgi:hypothetical protein
MLRLSVLCAYSFAEAIQVQEAMIMMGVRQSWGGGHWDGCGMSGWVTAFGWCSCAVSLVFSASLTSFTRPFNCPCSLHLQRLIPIGCMTTDVFLLRVLMYCDVQFWNFMCIHCKLFTLVVGIDMNQHPESLQTCFCG